MVYSYMWRVLYCVQLYVESIVLCTVICGEYCMVYSYMWRVLYDVQLYVESIVWCTVICGITVLLLTPFRFPEIRTGETAGELR
jgi:hypothetical protein